MASTTIERLHQGQRLTMDGAPLDEASAAVLMLHGRGASAESILTLSRELGDLPGLAYAAPQAAGHTWYPYSFMAPLEANEPWLSSALAAVDEALAHLRAAGIPRERTVLLGFSQGACLALEFAARHAGRFGGIVGFSGGLIGPEGMPRDDDGSLDGTPVFLGCSDIDAHIPLARVRETDAVLRRLGGEVDTRIYPGMGHTINQDELKAARALLRTVVGR